MPRRNRTESEAAQPANPEPIDPAPAEIKRRSAEVRGGWTSSVKARRQRWADSTWNPPLIMTIELVRQINESQE